jgi:hypothetical protein
MKQTLIIIIAVLLSALLACKGTAKKVEECNTLVTRVNETKANLRRIAPPGKSLSASDVKALSKEMNTLEKDLGKMELESEGLKPLVDKYRNALRKFVAGTNQVLKGVKKDNPKKLAKGLKKIEAFKKREDDSANELTNYCSNME